MVQPFYQHESTQSLRNNEIVLNRSDWHQQHQRQGGLFSTDKVILDAKYDKVMAKKCVKQQQHMTLEQHEQFKKVLSKHKIVFNGKLGLYHHGKFHLNWNPGAKPKHQCLYPVLCQREKIFLIELQHLIKKDVLQKCGVTNLASSTFIVPKKNNRVRWVLDFHELNIVLEQKEYPIPKIQA